MGAVASTQRLDTHPDVSLDSAYICVKSQESLAATDKTVGQRRPHVLVYPGAAKSHRPGSEVGKHPAVPSHAMLSSLQALLPPRVLVLPPCPGTTQRPGKCVYIHWEGLARLLLCLLLLQLLPTRWTELC